MLRRCASRASMGTLGTARMQLVAHTYAPAASAVTTRQPRLAGPAFKTHLVYARHSSSASDSSSSNSDPRAASRAASVLAMAADAPGATPSRGSSAVPAGASAEPSPRAAKTPPPAATRTLWPPWQVRHLSPHERAAYAQHGPDYLSHVDYKLRRFALHKAWQRRKRQASLERELGEDWFSISEACQRRADAAEQLPCPEDIEVDRLTEEIHQLKTAYAQRKSTGRKTIWKKIDLLKEKLYPLLKARSERERAMRLAILKERAGGSSATS